MAVTRELRRDGDGVVPKGSPMDRMDWIERAFVSLAAFSFFALAASLVAIAIL